MRTLKENTHKYLQAVALCLALTAAGCAHSQTGTDAVSTTTSLTPPPLRAREAQLTRDYVVREVRFPGGHGSIQLSGELTRPFGSGPFPAAVLITGSGPHDRNETTAGHRPFLILSDYLVRHGFAVLRYDDRGVGKSSGDYASAVIPDFATDAARAMTWLKAQDYVDESRTGYVGHSEGGLIAPLAARESNAQFLMLLAAPVLPLDEILILREQVNAEIDETTEEETAASVRRLRVLFEIIRASTSRERAYDAARQGLLDLGASEQSADGWAGAFTSAFLYWVARYDPSIALEEFNGPVLAVYPGEDTKIAPAENAEKVTASTRHPASKVAIVQGLNHLFQPVNPGSRSNYEDSDISFDDASLEVIGKWIEQDLRSLTPNPK